MPYKIKISKEVTVVSIIQSLYESIGLNIVANSGDVIGFICIAFLFLASLFQLIGKEQVKIEQPKDQTEDHKPEPLAKVEIEETKGPSWSERLFKGLSKSRQEIWGKFDDLFRGNKLNQEILEEVEELLYSSDLGPSTVTELIEMLEEKAKNEEVTADSFRNFLYDFLKKRMSVVQSEASTELFDFDKNMAPKTRVIMIVGVNGAGKTTTIGKLATKLTQQGAKVVVGACDTFRAAAVDQLEIWCQRAGATMIRAKEGANPSGVGYDALQKAINDKADYCILDTAGRLHTKGNLMDELKKSKDVLKKLDESAPHETLLVIDAITGQNALRQAEEFHHTLGLTGLILTKCDGSSKAGGAISIVEKLKTPITYIGVGENVEDLNIFNTDDYLGALLGQKDAANNTFQV